MIQNLKLYQTRIHALNHKWWHDAAGNRLDRNKGELLCLIHSEISEATEGELAGCNDDHLPDRRMAEVEMADAAIRIFDYAEGFGYDLQGATNELEMSGWDMGTAARSEWAINISLIHMHVSQAMEGERKSASEKVALTVRPKAEVNLAKTLVLIDRYCELHGYDLLGAIEAKLAYNQVRKDHTHEARVAADGKKW